jgi:glycosyltransferase involved in cell wall biosynthesis
MSSRLSGVVAATPAIGRHFPAQHCRVVQNFPLRSELQAQESVPYSGRPASFAYVGGIQSARGAEVMVDAIDLVSWRIPVQLHLAGRIDQAGLSEVLALRHGWERVVDHGWLTRASVARLLGEVRAGLVLFQPIANHLEAQPNKLFEYMSAGLPVIASDFPLWREIVMGQDCGLAVNPTDPKAVAGAMSWLLEHPAEAEAMGSRGRAAVDQHYNWDVESPQLLALYQELLGAPGACAA